MGTEPAPSRRQEGAPLWQALAAVRDPELPVGLVDLGLVYGLRREGPRVEVELSFTATACPAMDMIQEDVRRALLAVPGVEQVDIQVVWDPPWSKDRLSPRAREQLRAVGISV